MDVITIERDLTAWFASKLNLTVDTNIFRGGIPEGIEQGTGVFLGSELPATGFYGFRPKTWNAQVLSKFNDRDAAVTMIACLNGFFPCPGFTQGTTNFISVTPQGIAEPYAADDNGMEKWFVSFNLTVCVLTSGAQTQSNS